MTASISTGKKVLGGFAIALAILSVIGWVSYRTTLRLIELGRERDHAHEVFEQLQELSSELQDAEIGERGYALTGDEGFLEPYQSALQQIHRSLHDLHQSASDNPNLQRRLDTLEMLAARKLADLKETVDIRRVEGLEVAAKVVQTGKGKSIMDAIREYMGEVKSEQAALINQRNLEMQSIAWRTTAVILFGSLLSFMVVGIATLVINRDLTEQQRVEEETEALNKELQQRTGELTAVNKELEAFSYSVSHDLRAPLRHIDGFSKLLEEAHSVELTDEAREYIALIRDSAREMGQLVDDLLNLARVGRKELALQVTGLSSLVDEVVADLKIGNPARAIEWKLDKLPFVACDPGLMKQIFANLLSNAVKFTRPREPAVIEVSAEKRNGEQVILVRDNGVGFNMKNVGKLFGVFQRLHRQEDFEGTGVGLATVQRIIHKHGGRVWAEAELNRGASFYFTLGASGNTKLDDQGLKEVGNA